MNEEQLAALVLQVQASTDPTKKKTEEQVQALLKLAESREIRDFENIHELTSCPAGRQSGPCECSFHGTPCLYAALLAVLRHTALLPPNSHQLQLWKGIYAMSELPEFSNASFLSTVTAKISLELLRHHFVVSAQAAVPTAGRSRIGGMQTSAETSAALRAASECLVHAKQFVHYLYRHRSDLRVTLRGQLCRVLREGLQYLLHYDAMAAGRSGGGAGGAQSARIGALLEVLAAVIAGMGSGVEQQHEEKSDREQLLEQKRASLQVLHGVLEDVLLPLHSPNEMDEWRDQIPLVQAYHEPLVLCLSRAIDAERRIYSAFPPDLCDAAEGSSGADSAVDTAAAEGAGAGAGGVDVVAGGGRTHKRYKPQLDLVEEAKGGAVALMEEADEDEEEDGSEDGGDSKAGGKLDVAATPAQHSIRKHPVPPRPCFLTQSLLQLLLQWPDGFQSNTPKEVLLLHEVDTLAAIATAEEFAVFVGPLMKRLQRCLSHDNTRPIQRALQLFKNGWFLDKCRPHLALVFRRLLPTLFRGGELFWNPTVNKLTALSLRRLKEVDVDLFETIADEVLDPAERGGGQGGGDAGADAKSMPPPTTRAVDAAGGAAGAKLGGDAAAHIASASASAPSRAPPKVHGNTGVPLPKGRFNPATTMPTSTLPPRRSGMLAFPGAPAASTSAAAPAGVPAGMPGLGAPTGGLMPAAITGVAPWAKQPQPSQHPPLSSAGTPVGIHALPPHRTAIGHTSKDAAVGGLMPAEITGVAPWARVQPPPPSGDSAADPKGPPFEPPGRRRRDGKQSTPSPAPSVPGRVRLAEYMEKCHPQGKAGQEEDKATWNDAQAAPTPTLLPSLRFHDLVFGKQLGSGAFSTVKYCRQIIREKSSTLWPEFAVKIVPLKLSCGGEGDGEADAAAKGEDAGAEDGAARARGATSNALLYLNDEGREVVAAVGDAKAVAFDYSVSVSREIAILQLLSHPGISRLVSCFRYSSSAYLVLEYASRGDLHSYILATAGAADGGGGGGGSALHGLTQLRTRFVVGETLAALAYVHSQGFVYCDLKPENLLITALGHIKLTDFGACRPMNAAARGLLRESVQLLSQLRDGDWRAVYGSDAGADGKSSGSGGRDDDGGAVTGGISAADDARIAADGHTEGTLSYLPPEVLLHMRSVRPDTLADAWSVGCVAYFCLVGRPLFFGESVEDVLHQQGDMGLLPEGSSGAAAQHRIRFEGAEGVAQEQQQFLSQEVRGELGNASAADFLTQLLHPNKSQRLAVERAMAHRFLTHGSSSSGSDAKTGAAEEAEQVLDPTKLHFATPPAVLLPVVDESDGNGRMREDGEWARRQFSRIWAPMPDDYDVSDSNAAEDASTTSSPSPPGAVDAARAGFEAKGTSSSRMAVPALRQAFPRGIRSTLAAVAETEAERNSPFV